MSKIKNSIGNPDVEATTLRGTGKLDWTPRAKLNSTVKRLSSTAVVMIVTHMVYHILS